MKNSVNKKTIPVLKKKNKEEKKTVSSSPPRIKFLVVENDVIAQKIVKTMLKDLSHQVDLAETSEKAIKLFQKNKYDIVLTDIGLPGMDGYNLAKTLRQFEKKTNAFFYTPIIALTAHAIHNISRKAKASGIDCILNKPLSPEYVGSVIEKFLHKKVKHCHEITLDTSEDSQKKVIDLEDGAKILGKDKKTAKKFLFKLMASLEEHRQKLNYAFRSGSFKKLADVSHQLYGGLCYVGVPHVRKAAKELERSLLDDWTHHQVPIYYQELMNQLNALEKEFDTVYADDSNKKKKPKKSGAFL